ncbi:long-chain fatty acid--CoA ligase [Pseudonocardia eucalypti]|uniref:Long-chain fatty acid--CoA ligase n=1 Tax=Pseudonocardia eucalypti TaxID=648755 RepID=A0ABP9QGI0_9PSEU|nr:acyl-CoA synthetase (AMP-forming)/AMP-acid ligase II [Pseudonocardia eucalypti]
MMGYLVWNRPEFADRVCLRDEAVELTYGELASRVDAAAEHFATLGVRRGDVLAIVLPNRVELLIGLFAAWRLGATASPVNPVFTPREAGYQIRDSGAVLLLTEQPDADYDVPLVLADDLPTEPRGTLPPPEVSPEDLALLIYTSGSTGRPKGVMLDHANLVAMVGTIAEALDLGPDDHGLLVLPLFHVNAICVSGLAPMLVGAQVTILTRFAPATFLDAIERYRPTYFSGVPAIYARLAGLPEDVRPDASSVRFAVCGAAPVAKELLERMEARFGFPVVEGYGLTEATCASTFNPLYGVRKPGTVGPALPGQRVAVMAPDRTPRGVGQVGEVVVRGANVMRGYLNLPAATEQTLVDGWLHTGDVGYLDEDGYLTLVDRIHDMIIRGGENIYPKEIESVLGSHPSVMESAVIGAADEVYGEVPVAYVVLFPSALITADELTEYCRGALTKIKLPVAVHLVDELPKNYVGKIDKPALRHALRAPSVGRAL